MHKFKRLRQVIKVLLMLTAMGVAFSAAPVGAERLRINPVPPHVVPQWTPMPDVPQVYHAPNLPTDVFRHLGRYYFYWEGMWYKSKNTKGPWERLQQPPAILFRIQAGYFKTLPRAGGRPPSGAPPGVPPGVVPPGEGLLTPEGRPAVPPSPTVPGPYAPVPPAPPPVPPAPEPATPEPPATPQAPEPQAPEPQSPEPQSPEPAPPAAPENPLPKSM